MTDKHLGSGFQLNLDAEMSRKLMRFLEDQGLVQAAFEARESGGSATGVQAGFEARESGGNMVGFEARESGGGGNALAGFEARESGRTGGLTIVVTHRPSTSEPKGK